MDSAKPPSLRSLLTRIVGTVIALLLLLYPLSIGPAFYYIEKHYYMERHSRLTAKDFIMFNKVYAPLWFVVGKIPPLWPVFEAYVNFWRSLARER